jgi:hypothetical protein
VTPDRTWQVEPGSDRLVSARPLTVGLMGDRNAMQAVSASITGGFATAATREEGR